MRTLHIALLLCSSLTQQVWAAAPSFEKLAAVNQQSRCHYPQPRQVVYRGSTEGLQACLDGSGSETIDELRISSGGGGAWDAMRLMQRYAGRIDLVIVEELCASSCANYIIPAAKRLRVEPDSYVLLHGSPNLRDIDPQKPGVIEQMKAGLRADQPELPAAEIEKNAEAAWERMRTEIIDMQPVQREWASGRLACDDWLDPQRHLQEPLPAGSYWLLVTPEMAQRCLESTAIVEFWPPSDQKEFSAEIGFFRALH